MLYLLMVNKCGSQVLCGITGWLDNMGNNSTTNKERDERLSWQKTCHIFTVNLGHVDTIGADMTEAEIIDELEQHWADLLCLPNLAIARGQIERNESGILHINGGVKFSKPIRARTLQNRWSCWADPANNEAAVMNYGKKTETRVAELANFGQVQHKNKKGGQTPKDKAIQMLLAGLTPVQICAVAPDVYFTHHRSIKETWSMLQLATTQGHNVALGEEE